MLVKISTLRALDCVMGDDPRCNAILVEEDTARATDGSIALVISNNEPLRAEDYPVLEGLDVAAKGRVLMTVKDIAGLMTEKAKRRWDDPFYDLIALQPANGMEYPKAGRATTITTIATPQNGSFPAIDKVIPKDDDSKLRITLGTKLLSDLVSALKKLEASSVTLQFDKPDTAVKICGVHGAQDRTVTGAFMPSRE